MATIADIGLVAIDLDGTLLNDSKRVSERTAAALRCLPGRGVRVVIASARPPRSVRHIYRELGLDTWQINYNGAMIWDEPAARVVLHEPIEPATARRVVDHARGLFPGVAVSVEVRDLWMTDRVEQTYLTETSRLFAPDRVAPVDVLCREPVTKLLLLGAPGMITALASALAETHPDVSVMRSDPDLIQVMNRGASKATALRAVAANYRVPMDRVMAIGDAPNDVSMLTAAGVAVAMDNASADVKRAAHWTAPSNNDHGVHAALARYGLCE